MALTIQRLGDAFYTSNGDAVLEFSHLSDHAAGISAEILARVGSTGAEHWSRLNLAAPRSRRDLAQSLNEACAGIPWPTLLDEACRLVVVAYRRGDPVVPLVGRPPSPTRWLIPGLIPAQETSILYGDGGTMKSMLALAIAWAGLRGEPLVASDRWHVQTLSRVLYLDWESREEEHAGRWWGLCAGAGLDSLTGVIYLAMTRPLTDSMGQLATVIARESIDLVIVDSFAPACGLEPEGADAAVRTLNALRSLPCTRLVVAHVSKASADANGPARPYGSVFVRNLARATVEAKAEESLDQTATSVSVTYHHTKANFGPKLRPCALSWTFADDGQISVESSVPDMSRASIPAQILALLRHGKQTATSIADELGISEGQARVTLGRLETATRVLRLVAVSGGKGRKTEWGLLDANRNIDP